MDVFQPVFPAESSEILLNISARISLDGEMLEEFTSSLLMDGNVVIGDYGAISPFELEQTQQYLIDFETSFRLNLPTGTPAFDSNVGLWSAITLFRACQFAMHRDISAQTVERDFQSRVEPQDTPEAHYSVHLIFRFLPDLNRLTRSISQNDILGNILTGFAQRWPLSSVGIPLSNPDSRLPSAEIGELTTLNEDTVMKHPGLRQMYMDRIIKCEDKSRIRNRKIRDLVCMALGEKNKWCQSLMERSFES